MSPTLPLTGIRRPERSTKNTLTLGTDRVQALSRGRPAAEWQGGARRGGHSRVPGQLRAVRLVLPCAPLSWKTRVGERLRPRCQPRPGLALGTCTPESPGCRCPVPSPVTPRSPGGPQQDPGTHAAGHGGGHDRPRDRNTEHAQ